jgi:hypothetical protein
MFIFLIARVCPKALDYFEDKKEVKEVKEV